MEIEEMLQVNQAIGSIKRELRQLQSMRLEARKLKRESDALDIVVSRSPFAQSRMSANSMGVLTCCVTQAY